MPSIWAECVFVDPVADLAVLGEPDGSAFAQNIDEAWNEFIEDAEVLQLDTAQPTRGWMLSLNGKWLPCTLEVRKYGSVVVKNPAGRIAGGMSGSPILSDKGRTVGVVTISGGWLEPHLPSALSQWLAQQFTTTGRTPK